MDKLILINEINSSKAFHSNLQCAFIPFFTVKDLEFNSSVELVLEFLNKLTKSPPKIKGSLYFSKRTVIDSSIIYKFIVFFTEPLDPVELKIQNAFWCNKNNLKLFPGVYDYCNIGDELETILPVKEPDKYQSSNETCLNECKLIPYCTFVPNTSPKPITMLQKIITETKTDLFTQTYVYADFMVNSYPCKVMSFPQYIGFAVARGLYLKRVRKVFNILLDGNASYLTFDNFLFGCICMDLSSVHTDNIRIARGDLIFKYYDKNHDNILDTNEFSCLIKRMRKKMGFNDHSAELQKLTDQIMGLLNNSKMFNNSFPNKVTDKDYVTHQDFMKGLANPELSGLTHLLRFSLPYHEKAKIFTDQYLKNSGFNIIPGVIGQQNSLIPYFIEEAYSKEELLNSMLFFSQSYENIQNLLYKLDNINKTAVAKYKGSNLLSNFFSQLFYYFSEILFDVYNKEGVFPWRNPLFLTLVTTVIAIVYPSLFHSSSGFWNRILAFFSTSLPASYLFINYFNRANQNRPISPTDGGDELSKPSDHWLKTRNKYTIRREEINTIKLDNGEVVKSQIDSKEESALNGKVKNKDFRDEDYKNKQKEDKIHDQNSFEIEFREKEIKDSKKMEKKVKFHDEMENSKILKTQPFVKDEYDKKSKEKSTNMDKDNKNVENKEKKYKEQLKQNSTKGSEERNLIENKCEQSDTKKTTSENTFKSDVKIQNEVEVSKSKYLQKNQYGKECFKYTKRCDQKDNVDKSKSKERCEKANEHEQIPDCIKENFKIAKPESQKSKSDITLTEPTCGKETNYSKEEILKNVKNKENDCIKSENGDDQKSVDVTKFICTEESLGTYQCKFKTCKKSSN